jgi:hypothetical protein
MNKSYTFIGAALLAIGSIAMQRSGNSQIEKFLDKKIHKNAGGSLVSKTGAPGEQSCTSCHSGTAQSGVTENVFTLLDGLTQVTSYLPGQTYNVTLSMSSAPAKKGFQATALDGSNNMAGTFTGNTGGGTAVTTSASLSRQYANHTSASNTSSNMVWIWEWTAPATDVGNVTFYVATNKANNNGNDNGDVIYTSQHIIGSAASLGEATTFDADFKAGYNGTSNVLSMSFNSLIAGEMFLNLVDANGRSVFTYNIGDANVGENMEKIALPSDLKNGIYFVNVFVNNNSMQAKILIQK